LLVGKSVEIRNPDSVRPWQHVLDPLAGYLLLAEQLSSGRREFAEAWNFGPAEDGVRPVSWLVERTLSAWGGGTRWEKDSRPQPHEASLLKLDSSKARSRLSWRPRLDLPTAVDWTVEWYRGYRDQKDMQQISLEQLRRYGAIL
jgi:CDP-glucose 4,6-dehydratase